MALSMVSSTRTAAPSPSTKPSLCASKGLEALSGSSLRVERALHELNPATPIGQMAASEPPASTTSTSPRLTASKARPTVSAPLEQAETAL